MNPVATETQETQDQTVLAVFISRSPNQILTRRPVRYVDDGFGGKKTQTFDEWLVSQEELNDKREAAGDSRKEIDMTPWTVEFHNHRYEATHPRIVEWLEQHDTFDVPNAPSGFYREPDAPVDPTIALQEPMIEIAQAASKENMVDSLGDLYDIIEVEEAGENRPAIVGAAVAAITAKTGEPFEPRGDAGTGDGAQPSTSQP